MDTNSSLKTKLNWKPGFSWTFSTSYRQRRYAIPQKRMWVAIIVLGILFAGFLAGEISTLGNLRLGSSISAVAGLVFSLAWLGGWSIFTVLLGILFLFSLLGKQALVFRPGELWIGWELGPMAFVQCYQARDLSGASCKATPSEQDAGKQWRHLIIRCGEDMISVATHLPLAQAEEMRQLLDKEIERSRTLAIEEQDGPSGDSMGTALSPLLGEIDTEADASSVPITALILANLVPLVGVVFWGWNLSSIMVLYWCESAIIGLYSMAKLIVIAQWLSVLAIPLFWGHFIGFMAAHFLFINLVFINRGMNTRGMDQFSALTPIFNEIWLSLLALTVSHGISFYMNFVRRKEYESGNVIGLMLAPYKRVAIMHCTVLLGGFGSLLLGEPAIALIVLIAMKLLMDSRSHLKEHQPRPEENEP